MHYTLYPWNVCSSRIELDVREGRVHNVRYAGGCDGNLKALSILAEGMRAEELIQKLRGVCCGSKGTSCSDQLAALLEEVLGE